jgi:hypothetical protein
MRKGGKCGPRGIILEQLSERCAGEEQSWLVVEINSRGKKPLRLCSYTSPYH